jgi:UDP-glucose 4-epimerase
MGARNETVMVTGGYGYMGAQCVAALLDSGYDVVILDNRSTGSAVIGDRLKDIESEGRIIGDVEADLLDPSALDLAMKEYKVGSVVHLAALSCVEESVRRPKTYSDNNVVGTGNLLEAMRANGVDRIVFSSSAAVYGEPRRVPVDEEQPLAPINPYGETKMLAERLMDEYDSSCGIRSVRLRYFNIAGADGSGRVGESHDPETHLIPNILSAALDGNRAFSIYGDDYPTRDGTCVRDYVNVEDLADAHLLALDYLRQGGGTDCFNLGTEHGHTVKEVFETCERVTGTRIPVVVQGRRPGDPAVLVADSGKARRILGWTPSRSLEDSVRSAFKWEKTKRSLR